MSVAQTTISVQLVECTVDIIAMTGDKLMFFNGLCIGVYGEPQHPKPISREPEPKKAPRRRISNMFTQEVIYNAMKDTRAKNTAYFIANKIGMSIDQKRERASLSDRLRVLLQHGFLYADENKLRPEYHVTPKFVQYMAELNGKS
jgi:hypothetical protein